jgi:hypothetical protein
MAGNQVRYVLADLQVTTFIKIRFCCSCEMKAGARLLLMFFFLFHLSINPAGESADYAARDSNK